MQNTSNLYSKSELIRYFIDCRDNNLHYFLLIMKKILVALDYSPASKNAFEYALLLAKDLKAQLILLNVVLPIFDNGDFPREILDFAKAYEQDRATTLLKKMTTYYPNKDSDKFLKHNIQINYLVKEGAFVPTIIQTADELNCDLVIAGTKSGHHLSKMVWGSTVRGLIRKTTIPTLIIPENYTYQSVKTIAFATALDKKDEAAVLWIRQFAEGLKAKVESFFISELPYDISDELEEVWESQSLPSEKGKPTKVKVIRKASFKAGINYYLERYPVDILAMFVPKRTFINQLFHISKTQKMVTSPNIPLLIYHA